MRGLDTSSNVVLDNFNLHVALSVLHHLLTLSSKNRYLPFFYGALRCLHKISIKLAAQ